jgi:hypothetical protein
MMVDAQSEQLHGDMPLKRIGNVQPAVLETVKPKTTRSSLAGGL